MRTVLWVATLLTLLSALAGLRHEPPAGTDREPATRVADLELVVAWEHDPGRAPAANVWRAAFGVANLSDVASGPLRLRLRTPLGLVSESRLAPNLPAGGRLHRTLAVDLTPGLSELCIDVRAVVGERALAENDLSNNRACRRIDRRSSAAGSFHAVRLPEEVR